METVNGTKYFGFAEPNIAYGTYSLCGSPTVYIDGSLFSGSAVDLAATLTVGDWHILEYRGLDLSGWTVVLFGQYTGYLFPGARGDIMLFESTASTADKDAARQYLADKYGVTLA